jgi:DNA polymerase-4
MSAWVLHVDLDQFLAAVEVLRRPELAGLPVIVGGRGDPAERGVVSTASYEAREYGVRSGMALRIAARKCPDAVFLPVDFPVYEEASAVVMETLRGLAVTEVMGWDEAFLAVETDDPETFALRVRATVLEATQLHCSVGIGDNKLRAKIATEFGKPQGMFRLTTANWYEVMGERPTRALWGVGAKMAKRLADLGISTVRELADADPDRLAAQIGPTLGPWYWRLGRGIASAKVDDTPYVPRGRSQETTFQQDLRDWTEVAREVRRLTSQVMDDVRERGRKVERIVLKVRYAPFFTTTRSRKLPEPSDDLAVVTDVVLALVEKLDHTRAVRLLGVRAEMTPL